MIAMENTTEPIKEGQEGVIVIGEHLVEEEIRKYLYEEPAG